MRWGGGPGAQAAQPLGAFRKARLKTRVVKAPRGQLCAGGDVCKEPGRCLAPGTYGKPEPPSSCRRRPGSGTPPSWVRARQSPCSRLRRAHRARFPALGGRTARAQAEHLHSTTRSRVPGLGADPHLLGTHCVSGALLGQGPPSTHEDRKHINPGLRCVRWLHWLSKATEITCCIPRRAGQPPRGQRCQCPEITGQRATGGQGGSRPPLRG